MQHCQHFEQTGFTGTNLQSLNEFGDRQLPRKSFSDFNVRFLAGSALMIPFMDLASKCLFLHMFLIHFIFVFERGLSISLRNENEKR